MIINKGFFIEIYYAKYTKVFVYIQQRVEQKMTSLLSSVATLAGNVAQLRLKSQGSRTKRELSDFSRNLTISANNPNVGKTTQDLDYLNKIKKKKTCLEKYMNFFLL